jgi:hypothetical protein
VLNCTLMNSNTHFNAFTSFNMAALSPQNGLLVGNPAINGRNQHNLPTESGLAGGALVSPVQCAACRGVGRQSNDPALDPGIRSTTRAHRSPGARNSKNTLVMCGSTILNEPGCVAIATSSPGISQDNCVASQEQVKTGLESIESANLGMGIGQSIKTGCRPRAAPVMPCLSTRPARSQGNRINHQEKTVSPGHSREGALPPGSHTICLIYTQARTLEATTNSYIN